MTELYLHIVARMDTDTHRLQKKLLELEAEARRLSKVINVDNAQQISRLEKVAILEC